MTKPRPGPESVLAALSLFEHLSPEELHRLSSRCDTRVWTDGGLILREGESARGMYVVLQGVAKVTRVSPEGRESVLHLVRSGHTLGEAAMFQQSTFPATAWAVGEVHALYIEAEALRAMIAENPDLAFRMLAAMAARLRMFTHKLAAQGQGGATRRVAAWLLHRIKLEEVRLAAGKAGARTQGGAVPDGKAGRKVPFAPEGAAFGRAPLGSASDAASAAVFEGEPVIVKTGVPREVLANLLGLARETLSRQFSLLEAQGVIQRKGRDVVVSNMDALRHLASGKD